MPVKFYALLILGAVVALAAGLASFGYLRSMEAELTEARAALQASGGMRSVPILLRDRPRGEKLVPQDFGRLEVPARHLPGNVVQNLPQMHKDANLYALSDLRAGALLTDRDLGQAPQEAGLGFAHSPEGRVISLRPENLPEILPRLALSTPLDLYWSREEGETVRTRLIATALRLLELPAPSPPLGPGAIAPSAIVAGAVLWLEGSVEDTSRIVATEGRGRFYVLPSSGPLPLDQPQVEIAEEDLSALPLAVRRVEVAQSPTATLGDKPTSLRASLCQTMVVRGAARAQQEVRC